MMEVAITRNTAELERLEGIIRRNLQSFYEVGRALMEIRDKGLYRDAKGYATFEEYCKKEWDFSRIRAYQLIEAVEVKENVLTDVNTTVTEFQIRPLVKLTPEKQREAWQQAVSTAPEGKVTAAHVASVVKEMTVAEKPEEVVVTAKDDSINLSKLKVHWNASDSADKRIFIRWIWEYFGKYVGELFLQRIKTIGHINVNGESDALSQLKRWWTKATRKDKEKLFSWLREAR